MHISQRYPMTSFPNGWYAISSVSEIQQAKVLPIKALGKELVAFQTESGAISVLDAHCPHQGAHLGYGGTIKGESNPDDPGSAIPRQAQPQANGGHADGR